MNMADAREFLADSEVRRKALEDYRNSGFLVLRSVFTDSEIAGMRDTWSMIGESRRQDGKAPHRNLLMTHVSMPGVASVVRNQTLVRCIEAILDGKIELIQSQLMFGAPGAKGFSPHQDNFFNRAEPRDKIVAAWIAIDKVDRENGSLAAYPGSHVNGLVKTRRDMVYLLTRSLDIAKSLLRIVFPRGSGEPNDSGVVERYAYAETPPDVSAVALTMAPGSVAIMHGDLVHFSYPNQTSDRFRCSLVANYIRIGTRFVAGPLTRRTPFDVYAS
jgi:ectoine hydroxylase-related dioxygenase (phytanoyl-CoA dioxygenase family)